MVVEHLQFSNKILGRIEALQEQQIKEIKNVRWAIIGLFLFIVGQWIALKMKWGL